MKKWVCPICGYVEEGEKAPEFCPICKCPGEKFTEQRVQKRLAHQMKIKLLRFAAQAVGEHVELTDRKGALCPCRLGTEKAIEITYVGYFEIATRNHR